MKLHHLVPWVAAVASMAACSGGGGHPSAHSTGGAQAAAVVGPVAPGEATGAGAATAATPPAGATNAAAPTTSSPPAPAAANGTAPGIVSSRPGVVPPPPPGQNWAPATQGPPAVPVRADVDSPCVTPGGQQGLTIHTAPNDHVSFSTEYADHTNENIPSKQYQEGFGPGQADGTGVFRVTWHVPANAAAGRATIHFIAQSTSSATTFTVASDAAPVSSSHSCG